MSHRSIGLFGRHFVYSHLLGDNFSHLIFLIFLKKQNIVSSTFAHLFHNRPPQNSPFFYFIVSFSLHIIITSSPQIYTCPQMEGENSVSTTRWSCYVACYQIQPCLRAAQAYSRRADRFVLVIDQIHILLIKTKRKMEKAANIFPFCLSCFGILPFQRQRRHVVILGSRSIRLGKIHPGLPKRPLIQTQTLSMTLSLVQTVGLNIEPLR